MKMKTMAEQDFLRARFGHSESFKHNESFKYKEGQ